VDGVGDRLHGEPEGGADGAEGEYPHCPSIGRWIVERTFGWLSRNRRLARDYERKVQTSETL
jgi:hypothetical protein